MDTVDDSQSDSPAVTIVVAAATVNRPPPLTTTNTSEDSSAANDDDEKETSRKGTALLVYKTIGVVFGGLVTSPLYVFPAMPLESPTTDDYLGIYSIMFWTLTLIGVVKYACIALNADDEGEGGTFALYSLLCRKMNFAIMSSKRVSQSSQSWLGKFIENSLAAKRLLLFMAMLGMCMLIGDGIITPAISVISAIDGIKGPFPQIQYSMVKALSAIILILMFMLQRFGASRVSFLFSPIMVTWTVTTPLIGIYNIIIHYPGVFKAISPHYIFHFFWANGKDAWLLLSSIVLCITGTEALFADLGHFNKRSIQIGFICFTYPSLVLTYAGQTAYLIKNPGDHNDGFYKFIPTTVYWPMFVVSTLAAIVASQSLISATFSVIKQSVVLDYFPRVKLVHTSTSSEGEIYSPETNYILMILSVAIIIIFGDGKDIGNAYGVVVLIVMLITTMLLSLVMILIWKTPSILVALFFLVFSLIEGVYMSAVFTKIPEGGWIPFAISILLAFMMFGWFYGRQKKLEHVLTHKIDSERLKVLLSDPCVQRVPGLCIFYTNIQDGITPILGHYLRNMRSLHKVTVFTTLQYLLVPKVPPNKRVIVKKLGVKGVYGCLIQYGYADSLKNEDLVSQVTASLRDHIMQGCTDQNPEAAALAEQEVDDLEEAKQVGVVHVRGKTGFYVREKSKWFDRFMLEFYEFLHLNCRSGLPNLNMPLDQRIEVGMLVEA